MRLFFADGLSSDEAIALVRRLRERAELADEDLRETVLPLDGGDEAVG